jgi:hypothetical protein
MGFGANFVKDRLIELATFQPTPEKILSFQQEAEKLKRRDWQ